MTKKETDEQRQERIEQQRAAAKAASAPKVEQAAHNAAFGYIRVSSGKQLDGDGPERQEEKIFNYCKANNLHLLECFTDATRGRNELKDRKEMSRMMAKIQAHGVKTIVIENMDRLARDGMVSELMLMELKKLKVRVISAEGGIDVTEGDAKDPVKKFIRVVLGAVAELHKNLGVNRMWIARERIRAAGKRCEGNIGYGDKKGEWPIVERMFAMRAAGMSYKAITRELNASVLPRRGHYWYTKRIIEMMARIEKQGRVPTPGPAATKYAEVRVRELAEAAAKEQARKERLRLFEESGARIIRRVPDAPASEQQIADAVTLLTPVPLPPPESASPIQN